MSSFGVDLLRMTIFLSFIMIPFFQYNAIILGHLTLQVWGMCVAAGIIAATLVATRLAKKYLLPEEPVLDMIIWSLIGAFIMARVFHVVFYNLDYYLANPLEVFAFWQGGLSSLGGFFGALLALYVFAKARKFSFKELWPYFDFLSVSLWLGWGIGRIGCFLIHDHPGTLTHFILAVQYPGGARHDLGLYESILGFVLFVIFMISFKPLIKKRWGLVTMLSSWCYAVARFFLDFLRATDLPISDTRYAMLTPAQWGMVVIILVLTFSLFFGRFKSPKTTNVANS